jgi:hypothetical protein
MKKLRTLHTDVTINASKEKVWDSLFTRFGEIHLYNPALDSSHFIKGGKGEVGCERECTLDAKTKIVERIVKAEELKKFTVDVYDGNMPMVDTMIVEIELIELSDKRTTVVVTANFHTSPAFMGALTKGMMKAKLTDMLIGLKYYLETGKTVSKQTYSPIRRTYRQLSPSQSFTATA